MLSISQVSECLTGLNGTFDIQAISYSVLAKELANAVRSAICALRAGHLKQVMFLVKSEDLVFETYKFQFGPKGTILCILSLFSLNSMYFIFAVSFKNLQMLEPSTRSPCKIGLSKSWEIPVLRHSVASCYGTF